MKVLIVTFWFPPSNVIGAMRVGKLARYLHRGGHDVRVLTSDPALDCSLPVDLPGEHVIRTAFRWRAAWFDRLPPVWAAFRGSAGSGTVLFCGSGDEKCPQVQLWAQVRENGGDTGRGLKR